MPSKTSERSGPSSFEVVPFPFSDWHRSKRRPALVLSDARRFNIPAGPTVLATITTAKPTQWPLDIPLEEPSAAGLPQDSFVRRALGSAPDLSADLWPQLFSDVNCIALWINSEKFLTRRYSVLHWFHKRLEVNVKNPRENRCFQIVIVFSFGLIDNSNKCTVLWKIAARLITVSTSVNNEMWVKLRSIGVFTLGSAGRGSAHLHPRRAVPALSAREGWRPSLHQPLTIPRDELFDIGATGSAWQQSRIRPIRTGSAGCSVRSQRGDGQIRTDLCIAVHCFIPDNKGTNDH